MACKLRTLSRPQPRPVTAHCSTRIGRITAALLRPQQPAGPAKGQLQVSLAATVLCAQLLWWPASPVLADEYSNLVNQFEQVEPQLLEELPTIDRVAGKQEVNQVQKQLLQVKKELTALEKVDAMSGEAGLDADAKLGVIKKIKKEVDELVALADIF